MIMKPIDSAGSRGVVKIEILRQLKMNLDTQKMRPKVEK